MRTYDICAALAIVGLLGLAIPTNAWTTNEHTRGDTAAVPGEPLILGASEGERRLHRPPPGALSCLAALLYVRRPLTYPP